MSKIIWGINPVLEFLKTNPEGVEKIVFHKRSIKGKLFRILELAKKLGLPVKILHDPNFKPPKVPPSAETQGVVLYLSEFPYASFQDIEKLWKERKELPLVVALDNVVDPQNLGSIIRSTVALGGHGLIIPFHRSADITGTVVKVSSGAVFKIPIVKVINLKQALKFFTEAGLTILGLTGKALQPLNKIDLNLPILLIAGNEAQGIRPSIQKYCHQLARIPIGFIDSLNVAQAVSIALYEVARQREWDPLAKGFT